MRWMQSPSTENALLLSSLVILARVCLGVASTATGGPGRQLCTSRSNMTSSSATTLISIHGTNVKRKDSHAMDSDVIHVSVIKGESPTGAQQTKQYSFTPSTQPGPTRCQALQEDHSTCARVIYKFPDSEATTTPDVFFTGYPCGARYLSFRSYLCSIGPPWLHVDYSRGKN